MIELRGAFPEHGVAKYARRECDKRIWLTSCCIYPIHRSPRSVARRREALLPGLTYNLYRLWHEF